MRAGTVMALLGMAGLAGVPLPAQVVTPDARSVTGVVLDSVSGRPLDQVCGACSAGGKRRHELDALREHARVCECLPSHVAVEPVLLALDPDVRAQGEPAEDHEDEHQEQLRGQLHGMRSV